MEALSNIAMLVFPSVIAGFTATVIAFNIGLTDASNARSSHSGMALTAGGVSVIASLLALMGTLYFREATWVGVPAHVGVIGLALGMATLGLYDDMRGARSLPKLIFMVLVAIAASVLIGPIDVLVLPIFGKVLLPTLAGLMLSVFWIVLVVNAVNFVDGANGMLVGTMSVAAIGLMILSGFQMTESYHWALALLVGMLCFAPFNFRKMAAMFAGDVGALTAGFIFAVGTLWFVQSADDFDNVFVLPLLILPILVDVFMTLLRRVKAGENILQAHNQHLFQRQIQAGASHVSVGLSYLCASTISTSLAVLWVYQDLPNSFFLLIVSAIISVAIYSPLYRRAMAKINAKTYGAS